MLKSTRGRLLHAASSDFTGGGADVPQALALVVVLHGGRGPRSACPQVQWKSSTTSGDQETAGGPRGGEVVALCVAGGGGDAGACEMEGGVRAAVTG